MSERLSFQARRAALETELPAQFPDGNCVIVSLANARTGSTAGSISEVNTQIAARQIANDDARLASDAEVAAFRTPVPVTPTPVSAD